MENRNGLIVKAAASQATGKAERGAVVGLLTGLAGSKKRTVGADKNYDTAGFVTDCRAMNIRPTLPGTIIAGMARPLMGALAGTLATRSVNELENGGRNLLVGAIQWA